MIPTVTSVSPSSGPCKGRYILRIAGTGFRVAPPATVHPAPAPRSVQVQFSQAVPWQTADGRTGTNPIVRQATQVRVESSTSLTCLVPIGDHGLYDGKDAVAGLAADITVTNLDTDGNPIAGETVTAPAAFTYGLPSLAPTGTVKLICAAVIEELKRQVCPNVVLTAFVDYDDALTEQNPAEPHLPSLTLTGPTLSISELEERRPKAAVVVGSEVDTFEDRRLRDLSFELLAAIDDPPGNFMDHVVEFFEQNLTLHVYNDPADPAAGELQLEGFQMELTEEFSPSSGVQENDVQSFRGAFVVKGVEIRGYADAPNATQTGVGYTADTVAVTVERQEEAA